MQRLIYPMQTISFTQLENSNGSHHDILAIDMNGEDGGIENGRAPCDVQVLAIDSGANTVFFGSLNKVLCADGIERKVTIAMTHDNYVGDIKVGRIFRSGEVCYQEGTKSASGNHIHIEVCSGWRTKKTRYVTTRINGRKYIYKAFPKDVALYPTKVFFALEGWNKIRKGYDRGVKFTWCDSRVFQQGGVDMEMYIHTFKKQAVRSKPMGALLCQIPAGNSEAVVTDVLPRQNDGFQWVKVKYLRYEGFAQYDQNWFEMLRK